MILLSIVGFAYWLFGCLLLKQTLLQSIDEGQRCLDRIAASLQELRRIEEVRRAIDAEPDEARKRELFYVAFPEERLEPKPLTP